MYFIITIILLLYLSVLHVWLVEFFLVILLHIPS